jgi:hypothetical protein
MKPPVTKPKIRYLRALYLSRVFREEIMLDNPSQPQEQHQMQLEKTHPSGAEEWHCPTCSRRFLIQWEPFKRIIIENGDEYAVHSGGNGGLQMDSTHIDHHDEPVFSEELRSALSEALEGIDFDDWPSSAG